MPDRVVESLVVNIEPCLVQDERLMQICREITERYREVISVSVKYAPYKPTGWLIPVSKLNAKYHYFLDGVSLCRAWRMTSDTPKETRSDIPPQAHVCAKCYKHAEKNLKT